MASSLSVYTQLTLMGTGDESNNWGNVQNAQQFVYLDAMLGATTTKSLSSSNVDITIAEARVACLTLTGTLSANVTVTWPLPKFFLVRNYTTGNFKVTLQYTGGVGATVIPPQGVLRQVMADSVNGLFAIGLPAPGTLESYAGGASGLPQSLTGEWLPCDGSAVSRTTYAQLFNAIGTTYGSGDGITTFNVPDSRGRTEFGLDIGGTAGRITTAGSGINGATLGATGGAQNVALLRTDFPNTTVTVNITDPGHTHTSNALYAPRAQVSCAAGGFTVDAGNTAFAIDSATTGISASFPLNGGVTQTTVNKMPGALIATKMIKT